jgi:Tfp pilus assembly protein PilN
MRRIPTSDSLFGKITVKKSLTIKTEWASLCLADDGNVIVCAKYNGTPRCLRYSSLEQFQQAINEKRVLIKKLAVVVPRSSCILKSLALPASDLDEASRMIEFELPSLVPLSADETIYGSTLLNRQDNMLNTLVCILKLHTLEEHLEPYRVTGIEIHRIALSSLAIQFWFNAASQVTSKPTICALMNKHRCAIQTCIDGNLHRANELTFEGLDTTASSHEIVGEILRQQGELPASLKETVIFVLAGSENRILEVKNVLCSILPESDVAEKISIIPNPSVQRYADGVVSEDDGDRFAWEGIIALGLFDIAVRAKLPHSNLLPQQYAKRHVRKALLFKYLRTGCLSLVLILLIWLCLVAMNWRTEKMSRRIESQIAPIEHTASMVDRKRQRVNVIQEQLSNRGQITAIIDEIYKYTPKAISLSELRFMSRHGGVSIEIKGQADLLSTAFSYTDAMSKANLLNNLQIENAQQIPRPGGSVVVFKAYCDIRYD